ncbi:DUF2786 domain-containing protein [Roseateles asaccharophilus]|uniref:DUF2786 domain-containing protein n=1 Tax=Roseateles asaccharophilus TaxID=582607 RepID=UPI00286C0CE9|nr:DUF2786 domain-containing protein [Roseateles asaccharophilus]
MLDAVQRRALAKVQKCLNLAADARGDATTRETAWRQAQVLIEKHGLQLERLEAAPPAAPAGPPPTSSPLWAGYWAARTTAEALAAGVRSPVLCRNGWCVPG